VRSVLADAGIPPAPQRDRQSWRNFLRRQRESMLACDFLVVHTVWLRRLYPLVFLSIGSRRVEYLACTKTRTRPGCSSKRANLLMDLDDRDRHVRFLVHDRDSKFSAAFDAVFTGAGVRIVRTPVRAPNVNAHVERLSALFTVSASTDYSSPAAATSSTSFGSTYAITTAGGRTARSTCGLRIRLRPPRCRPRRPVAALAGVQRRDLLGGLIHEYHLAA
jgi:hypothetical protein